MPKHPKRPRDPAQLAKLVVDIATGDVQDVDQPPDIDDPMSALGRLGGLRGGVARAESLSPAQRADIALKAARARWGKDGSARKNGRGQK
jgi:hypothetical protein